ncbi:MAG: ATP-binding protein [Candidatus Cloacimonetes bacterium]|nr:ATP-binding protein [Candidatus Cloacimonadota bacterium]
MKKQTETPDPILELEGRLALAKTGTDRLEILVELVRTCFHYQKRAKTKSYVLKALMLAKRLNNTKHQAYLNYIAGANLINLSENSEALDYLIKALDNCQSFDNHILTSDILGAIGFVYGMIGDYEHALEYQLASIEKAPENIVSLNNAGYVYTMLKDFDKALNLLLRGHELAKKRNITEVALTTLVNIASNYYNLQDYQTSLQKFAESYKESRKHKSYTHQIYSCSGLSKIYHILGDNKRSGLYIRKAEKITELVEYTNSLQGCYATIADAYENLGDFERAYYYFKKNLELKKLEHTEELTRKLSAIQVNYEIEKNDLETMRMIEKSSRLATIGIIAEGIVHDIGKPLNAIKISADSILFWDRHNPGYLPPIIVNVVKNISESSQRMDDIIVHMREFWINPVSDSENVFDLNNALDNALLLIATRIASHGIDLKISTTKQELPVNGNQIYVEQVIINLIFNSIQVLDSSEKKNKIISLSSNKKGDWAYIEVQDNGPGMTDDISARIYEPFYTTKNKNENMGLGLAIVRQIVNRFDGTLEHRNRPQGGVAFTIGIPLVK